jgi:hypothetical protein
VESFKPGYTRAVIRLLSGCLVAMLTPACLLGPKDPAPNSRPDLPPLCPGESLDPATPLPAASSEPGPTASATSHASHITFGATTVNGRLHPEKIQASVRGRWRNFERCYQERAEVNPCLAGRVSVRLVIGRDGLVKNVSNGGSTLPDPEVISCVQKVFSAICFDHPEAGIVTVVYPINFGS